MNTLHAVIPMDLQQNRGPGDGLADSIGSGFEPYLLLLYLAGGLVLLLLGFLFFRSRQS